MITNREWLWVYDNWRRAEDELWLQMNVWAFLCAIIETILQQKQCPILFISKHLNMFSAFPAFILHFISHTQYAYQVYLHNDIMYTIKSANKNPYKWLIESKTFHCMPWCHCRHDNDEWRWFKCRVCEASIVSDMSNKK